MSLAIFIKGFSVGFTIAAIIGPISILCIRRTLTHGQSIGLAIGLGSALADAVYGALAGFGFTFVTQLLIKQQSWLQLIGGFFLVYLGIRAVVEKLPEQTAAIQDHHHLKMVISTFLLTLTNPVTILSFAAIFAGLAIEISDRAYLLVALLVSGIFIGAMCWWIILTSVLRFFHTKVKPTILGYINKISGSVLVGFGVLSIMSVVLRIRG